MSLRLRLRVLEEAIGMFPLDFTEVQAFGTSEAREEARKDIENAWEDFLAAYRALMEATGMVPKW